MTQQQRWGSSIAIASLAIICIATLRPGAPIPSGAQLTACSRWENHKLLADAILNVLLFMPLGFGARWAGIRPSLAIAAGGAISSTIELLQLWVIPNRDASVLDVIANTLGTSLGLLMAMGLTTILRPVPRAASKLIVAWSFVWVLTFFAGGWALRAAPGRDPLWGERVPELGGAPKFDGELLSARLNGLEVPSARIARDDLLRDQLRQDGIRLDADVRPTADSGTTAPAPIVRVADGCGREILVLGSSSEYLAFRFRMRATALGLETPGFSVAQAVRFPTRDGVEERGEIDTITVREGGGRVRLAVRSAGVVRTAEFRLSPGLWWSFFVPWDYSLGPLGHFWTSVWMGVLLMPLGYWAARAKRERAGRRTILLSAASIVASIAFIPVLQGFPATTLLDWGGSIGGALIGFGLASSVRGVRE